MRNLWHRGIFLPNDRRETIFAELLNRLTEEALHHSFLIEFRNLEDAKFGYRLFRQNKYFPINWLRVRNSLHGDLPPEKRFSPSRLRQIRKGLKNGAEVRETHDPTEIQSFAKMLHRVYSFKVRRHFPSMRFFRELEHWLTKGAHSRIYIVTYHGRIIGGSACIYSGQTAYLWFSGGMRKDICPAISWDTGCLVCYERCPAKGISPHGIYGRRTSFPQTWVPGLRTPFRRTANQHSSLVSPEMGMVEPLTQQILRIRLRKRH